MMQIYRYFKFTDFIICKFARKSIFTAFRYTHDDDDDDDDDDEMTYLENPEDAHHPDQPDHLPCSPNHLSIIIIFGRYDDLTII